MSILPILAGLGALALMSNPPKRRKRRAKSKSRRKNPDDFSVDPWYGKKIPRGTGVSYLNERTGHSVHTVVVLNRGQRYKCKGAAGEITFHDRQDLRVGEESSP